MKLRSIALQKHKHDEVIDILSDSSDEEQPHQDNHLMDSDGKSAKDLMKKDNVCVKYVFCTDKYMISNTSVPLKSIV